MMKTFDILQKEFREFRDNRDWKKYHTPKDISLAMFIEMGEIAEHFLWKTSREIEEIPANSRQKELVGEELADVFFYLISLADSLNIDLLKSARKKLQKNREKYPVEKVKGKAHKYTYYQTGNSGQE